MLKIFNQLEFFFEDVNREISVRQYAKILNISPPSASKLLKMLEAENILTSYQKGIYIYYSANRDFLFEGLSNIYWQLKLKPLTKDLHKKHAYRKIILFGSIAKAENTIDSDIDIYIDIKKTDYDTKKIEKTLKRTIELHFKTSNEHLNRNIDKGIRLW